VREPLTTLATEEELAQFAWAQSLNPKPLRTLGETTVWLRSEESKAKTLIEETLIERGLRLLRGGAGVRLPEDDIEEKRRRKERAAQGIITMGRM
jgi:hypothetical protein